MSSINGDLIREALLDPGIGSRLCEAIVKYSDATDTPLRFDNVNKQFYELGRQELGQIILKEKAKLLNESTRRND
ncbi:MAG: hypothetical protein MJH10_09520 [Epibacterium sp.]|nr:hypothetical protein [Epibacterium sp.]NQX73774.1 hypothetical protein [Epibacterium sp.]